MPLISSGRRGLHQPFFFSLSPSPSSLPPPTTAQPPLAPTTSPFPFTKYPSSSSSTSSSSSSHPFFPFYPSPPPPPLSISSLPTFPANISSLVTPSSRNAPRSSKLIPVISFPILALVLLSLVAAFFVVRRKRSCSDKSSQPVPDNIYNNNSNAPSSSTKPATATAASAVASSEFLYLGTLVNSRGTGHVGPSSEVGPTAADSPELRPLPPLARQACRRSFSSSEEFYSPTGGAHQKPMSGGSHSPVMSKDPTFLAKDEQTEPFLAKRSDFEGNPFVSSPPRRQAPQAPTPPPPPPPPPPATTLQPPVLAPPKLEGRFMDESSPEDSDGGGPKCEELRRPKLKALHWDKVRASSDRTMVWDHLKSSSFQLNEEMIETLFGCDTAKGFVRRKTGFCPMQENVAVLDPKKSQNIAILLRALNVTTEEVCEALLEGNSDSLGNELLETLLKMAPSKEEEIKLREYKDDSPCKLGPAEKFLKAMIDIPFAFKRVDAMLYIANFDSEVLYLRKSFETLELACEELRTSRLFRKLLDAVLKTGNRMNVGTNRGEAQAFKLDTLLKLADIKGTDGKTTLLHFVVQEISRTEGFRASAISQSTTKTQSNTVRDDLECRRLGLQVVSGLGAELSNVKKAATMDSEILGSYVSKLSGGIGKIREVVRLNGADQHFHESMIGFLKMAESEITKLQSQEGVAYSLVKEITEYFHGDSGKEEAHPFRIFMVVRDFLAILDQVCRDAIRVNERSAVGSARQFPVPDSPTRPSAFQPAGSSDDDSSSIMSSLSS